MRSLAICGLVLFGLSAPARAQTLPAPENPTPAQAPTPAEQPAHHYETRVYFGMWTIHLREPVVTLQNNWVVGFTTHGYFGATFLNTFGNRAFTGGIQRTLISTAPRPLSVALGMRLG